MSIYLGDKKTVKSSIKTTDFLKKDGSIAMAGNLDLGNYAIDNLKTYPDGNKNATSRKYVDDETAKLLDLDANRSMKGDLNMNDNAIIGIEDISAGNSVPSKKFVKDEVAKINARINQNDNILNLHGSRNITMQNEINTIKSRPLYSHYFEYFYQNPVKSVYSGPHTIPSGFPFFYHWLTEDYNDETEIVILGLNTDNDSTLPTTNVNLSLQGVFHSTSGGYNSKEFLVRKNIHPYRVVGENEYYFHDDLKFKLKDLHNNWRNWHKFFIKVAVPWSGNETRLTYCLNYYK